MIKSSKMPTRIKLKRLLQQRGISVYRLSQETKGQLSIQSLYNLTGEPPPKRIELASLDAIVEALHRITGEEITVCDLLEYERE